MFPRYHRGQWYLATGQQNDLWIAPMKKSNGSWVVEMDAVTNLSQSGGLIDHSFQKCPDGRFIHVASTDIHTDNLFFVYDENFEIIDEGLLEQKRPSMQQMIQVQYVVKGFQAFGTAELIGERDYLWFF